MRQTLISWAATSCFLILAVIALRAALGKRMGAGLRYALWGLVLVRLLVPVQLFTSPVVGTVIDSERIVVRQTQTEREVLDALGGQDGPTVVATAAPYFPAAPAMPDPPPAPEAPDWREIPAVLGWLWLAGGAVMALVLAGCNLNFYLRLRRTRRPLDEQRAHDVRPYTHLPVYTAQGLPSPCLFGVFRPAIYVAPETAADPAALRHVLAHEGTHYRHGDHVWSLLRCAALCAHWWNPLVWLAAKLSRRDGELACDEGALKRLGDGERTAYGNTLLALVTGKAAPGGPLLCSTSMTGDKKSLKERFARIARAPRRAAGIAAAAVILAALMTVCAFGQKTSDPTPWEELEADLSLTVEEDRTVRITGTVDGMELPRGAFWYSPDYRFSDSPYGELSLVYPPFTDGIEGQLSAWWADESHTAVNLSTNMMAMLSSYFPSGYWKFTVDFSGGEAAVTRMEAIADFPEGMEVQMHPKTISDEEAIRAGRIAARLLTAAEEFYGDCAEKEGAPPETPAGSETPAPSESAAPGESPAPSESATQDESPAPSETAAPSESAAPGESPAPTESEDPMANHLAGLAAAMAEQSKPRRPAEDLADMTQLPYHPDLNGNGVPETLLRGQYYEHFDPAEDDTSRLGIGIWEGNELIWSSTNYDTAGSNYNQAFLLMETRTGPHILEYRDSFWKTSEGQTGCSLEYDVYDLAGGGYHSVAQDAVSYYYGSAQAVTSYYDAQAIARFKDGADALLTRGKLLLDNSGIFAGKGQEVDLTWMEEFAAGFTWDDSASSLENLTRFKELSLNPPQSAPVTDATGARAALRAAMLGETDFTLWGSQGGSVTVDIDTAPPRAFESLSAEWEKYNSFAVVDLDGDGVEEVVYHVTDVAGDMGGHLILRWAGPGDLRCYSIRYSHLMDLKADGSFWYSMMAGMGGMGGTVRLSFPAPGYVASMQYLTEFNAAFTPETPYKVNGEIVSKEEYDAAQAKQDAKPDAVWYDFTPENVKKALG